MNPLFRRASAASVMAVLLAATLNGTVAAAPSGRATLAGSVPAWATASNFKSVTSASENVGFRVYLGWTDPSGAASVAAAVSNPASPSYGKYLTPVQFHQQFSSSRTNVGAVTSWLKSQGFAIDYTPSNNLYVAAEGTVAQASTAFGVAFGNYSVKGMTLRSPESAVSIPADIAGTVEAIAGLDESAALIQPSQVPTAPPPTAFINATPCSTYWDQYDTGTTLTNDGIALPDIYRKPTPWTPCGYGPQQVRGAYGVPSRLTGSGVTVAIVDAFASPTIVSDVNMWSANRGIAQLKPGQFSQVVAPGTYNRPETKNQKQDPQGWSGEQTLDIESVHGMAPDANIVYVGAPNSYQDLDAALNHVVDRNLATIVTNSYGFGGEALPVGFIKPSNDIFIQAAAEGIGVYFSSGDNADETGGVAANAPYATPDWPASSPWVTAVGGTSIGIGKDNSIALETGWETGDSTYVASSKSWVPAAPGDFYYGSGGGTSRLFTQPSYQAGVVPASMSNVYGKTAMRVVPDVSAIADPQTGLLVGQTQAFPDGTAKYAEYRIGGTSLASPIFAGLMADRQQQLGHVIGFANPMLYALPASAFNDIRAVDKAGVVRANFNNGVDASGGYQHRYRSFDFTSGLTIHTVVGYDNVIGRGSINGANFFK